MNKNKNFSAVALILAAAFLALSPLKGQVTIGALRTPNSTLDVATQPDGSTAADGIMAPRVTLSQLNARSALFTTAQTGALVYVTLADVATIPQTVNIKDAGYYYFDGAVWVKIMNSKNPAWLLGGNANGSLQTLGTKDANDLPVITNNTEKMRVTAGGNVGINTNNPTSKLHIVGDTATVKGNGFRLVDGNESEGFVLTSDAAGVATWKLGTLDYKAVPTTVQKTVITTTTFASDTLNVTVTTNTTTVAPYFRTVGSRDYNCMFLLKNTDGKTPYYLEFPDYGTYFVSLEVHLGINNIMWNDINCDQTPSSAMQLCPTPNINNWGATTPDKRYTGQYEVYALRGFGEPTDFRYTLNQMIQVTPQTGLKGYLVISITFFGYPNGTPNKNNVPVPSAATPITFTVHVGNNALPNAPQISGGAYVKLSDVH